MHSYIEYKSITTKKQKLPFEGERLLVQPKADHQGSNRTFRDFSSITPYIIEKELTNKIHIVRKPKTIKTEMLNRIRLHKSSPEKPPKTIIRKLKGGLMIILSNRKIIYTPLHGERKLEGTISTFVFSIKTQMEATLMKVTHRDQILLLSRNPIFMTRATVKTGKLAPILPELR